MISRKHRFHGYGSLNYVYRHGQMARGPLFAVKAVHNSRRQDYRVAVVVSRKVNKSAVGRNRLRRRLYEAVRALEGGISQPFDIVITVFQDGLSETPPAQLREQLKKQLEQAGALK